MDDLFFNQDHIMIKDMVREFAESEILPVSSILDEEEKFRFFVGTRFFLH